MPTTNIFYRIPSQPGMRVATLDGPECTLLQFKNYLSDVEGFDRDDYLLACNTRVYRPTTCEKLSIILKNNSHVDVLIPLLGGKGGFGSLLRAIGAQIEKTTNRDACRDLSGRRLRDIKREEELKKLIALQERLHEERKRRRKEKLEKLKKKSEISSTSASIQELVAMFDDKDYNKRRLELSDIIEVAVDKGIINFKKRQQIDNESHEYEKNKKSRLDHIEEESTAGKVDASENKTDNKPNKNANIDTEKVSSTTISKEITQPPKLTKINKNDLWLGLEEEEEDDDEDV